MSYADRVIQGIVGLDRRQIEGQYMSPALSRQGAAITLDWLTQLAIDGRTFHAQQGDAVTLVNFAETAYDEDQPQFALTVPQGTTVIPLSIDINLQDAAGTDTHIVVSTTTNDIGDGTSTAATISAMRRDAPYSSQCSAWSLYTGNATAATGLIEIARVLDPFAAASGHGILGLHWNARNASAIPVLVGPATLQWHIVATSTAPQGFSELIFAELQTPDLVRLSS